MISLEYKIYLKSPTWKTIRALIKQRSKGFCEFCYIRASENIHHRIYPVQLGLEDLRDLMDVCKSCHRFIHKLSNKGQLYADAGSPALLGDSGKTLRAQLPGHWMSCHPYYKNWLSQTLPSINSIYGVHFPR